MKVPLSVSSTERRDWYRLPLLIPFFVRGKNSNGEEFLESATALDISAGGALLATKHYVEPSTHISLAVPIALVQHKVHWPHSVSLIEATVLRCTRKRGYFLLGLQFPKPLIAPSSQSEDGSSAANS